MRWVILGAPGSGKGSQAELLKEKYGCAHISTGDILRKNLEDNTELGLRARAFVDDGELAPDELVIDMVKERLREDDAQVGFIMDGFPRTLHQAEAFEKILADLAMPLDGVLFLIINEELLVQRLLNRRTCHSCGKIWNVLMMASESGVCPDCGGELYHRDDDTEHVILHRLAIYHEQTVSLKAWYEEKGLLYPIVVSHAPQETFKAIQQAIVK